MIRQVKARTSSVKLIDSSPFPCSIKIRIDQDIKVTLELAKRAEKMGASWIAVHGRTQKQRNTTPVNAEAIKIIKESLSIPVFFNGQVSSLAEADYFQALTSVDGVMSATGLLHNPALFAGYSSTPWAAVMEYMKHAINYGTTSFIFHHHLMFMRIKC
jgi:tRNA-dihydrouridine synthase 4